MGIHQPKNSQVHRASQDILTQNKKTEEKGRRQANSQHVPSNKNFLFLQINPAPAITQHNHHNLHQTNPNN